MTAGATLNTGLCAFEFSEFPSSSVLSVTGTSPPGKASESRVHTISLPEFESMAQFTPPTETEISSKSKFSPTLLRFLFVAIGQVRTQKISKFCLG